MEKVKIFTHRERIKRLFQGKNIERVPCFSGMGHITRSGLREHDIKFCEIHNDPEKMAKAAASTYKIFDYECAVVPFDVCFEAEILGCKINFYEQDYPEDILYPTVERKIWEGEDRPNCQRLFEDIPPPRVLHICGNTNPIVEYMMECGADALSFDQKNDIARTRERLGNKAIILGNLDPYNLLAKGSREEIRQSVRHCIDCGISGIWPGDDLWPEAPDENIWAMIQTTRETRRG